MLVTDQMSGLLNPCLCMPIQLTLIVWVWLYLCDILRFLDTHFICNLCWGGIIGHVKFSMFSTTRLSYIADMTQFARLLGHDGIVQARPITVKLHNLPCDIHLSKLNWDLHTNSMTCKNLMLFNLKTTLFWSWVSVPWSRFRATLPRGPTRGEILIPCEYGNWTSMQNVGKYI